MRRWKFIFRLAFADNLCDNGTVGTSLRSWRNWQTRTVQVRVGNHGGSNPLDRTITLCNLKCYRGFFMNFNIKLLVRGTFRGILL